MLSLTWPVYGYSLQAKIGAARIPCMFFLNEYTVDIPEIFDHIESDVLKEMRLDLKAPGFVLKNTPLQVPQPLADDFIVNQSV